MKKEIFKATSTNGRWGLVVVGPEELDYRPNEALEGSLTKLGEFEGHEAYEFTPGETGVYYLFGGDIESVVGATQIATVDLQSSKTATIIAGGEFFVVESFGYKRRSSDLMAYQKSQEIEIPAAVMAAMGLIEATPEAIEPEIPAIPNPLQQALKESGLA